MKTKENKKGFTLVETMVATAILVLMVTGAFAAAQSGLSGSIIAKDQIIAFNLAQEGIEQIRNIRDSNGLTGQNWLAGISASVADPCYFGSSCKVDAFNFNGSITSCNGVCPLLKQDSTTGLYGYNGTWPDTIYQRDITLSQINANEVAILVTISWSKGLTTKQFKARENILNWQ